MAEPYELRIELSRRNFVFGSVCVRDWSGILCEPCGKWERELGAGNGNGEWEMGNGSGESEQRYSGKPDGLPERPNQLTIDN